MGNEFYLLVNLSPGFCVTLFLMERKRIRVASVFNKSVIRV
jgi:hypothetical protein